MVRKTTIKLGLVLLICLGLSLPQTVTAKSTSYELKSHWAKDTIENWKSEGFISGYVDGTFKPDEPITRAEWIKLINTSLGFSEVATVSFKDVKTVDWYATDIGKAVNAGYLTGYQDNTVKPNSPVTREEAAVMLHKTLWLPSEEDTYFKDTREMASWSRGAIGALAKQQLISGYNGRFAPKASLTRAEAVVMLDKLKSKDSIIFDQAGTYGPEIGQAYYPMNIILSAPGIVFRNATVQGNLTISEKVGQGEVFLNNIMVKGTTNVYGGGENSIHFENTVMLNVVVDKNDGTVRLVVEGKSLIGELTIQSNAKVETTEGSSVENVTLSDLLPQKSRVELTGSYESVNVLAQSIVIDMPSGTIDELNVDSQAIGNQFNLNRESEIIKLILNAASTVFGDGVIRSAVINSEGIKMDKAPINMALGDDVSSSLNISVGGNSLPVSNNTNSNNTSNPSSSNSSGNSSSNPGIIITPSPEDKTAPYLTGVPYSVYSGNSFSVSSNEDGVIYVVSPSTIPTKQYLDIAVQEGKGTAYNVKANESLKINTENMKVSDWIIVALDLSNNISSASHFFIYNNEELQFLNIGRGVSNHEVSFQFNIPIFNNKSDFTALKDEITFSIDGGITFSGLSVEDQVWVYDQYIMIDLVKPIQGNKNIYKINAGSLKDESDNVYNKEVISQTLSAGPYLTLESSKFAPIGQDIRFHVDSPGTAYLIPGNHGSLNKTSVETLVAQGKGKKLIVEESDVNTTLTFSTDDLLVGETSYCLYILNDRNDWGGNVFVYLNDGILSLSSYYALLNDRITFFFNDSLSSTEVNLDELKSKIFISEDGGVSFNPLNDEDTVVVSQYSIVISLNTPYTGTETVIKIEAGALKGLKGQTNPEIITDRLP